MTTSRHLVLAKQIGKTTRTARYGPTRHGEGLSYASPQPHRCRISSALRDSEFGRPDLYSRSRAVRLSAENDRDALHASVTVTIPAAQKLERGSALSDQYAGGLFEHVTMLIGDALFHTMWKQSGKSADDIWPAHANLE